MELTHDGHAAPGAVPEAVTRAALDDPRLRRLLGVPELEWLVERVRGRLVAGQSLTGAVSLATPTPGQRSAVERLLARPPGGGRSLTVRLEAVDAVLRRSGISPDGLAAAVTALTGPVTPLAQIRAEQEAAWDRAYTPLEALVRDQLQLRGRGAGRFEGRDRVPVLPPGMGAAPRPDKAELPHPRHRADREPGDPWCERRVGFPLRRPPLLDRARGPAPPNGCANVGRA
ncbi:TIGR02679 domain-containing protein [Streptomyces sp. NPDC019396]|uniref:TIGR02679 domain-containing protein n=1 Tax=Streptomyces sp. NPDC019396 TaxID=3154687 RepID=UPI0033ED5F18